MAKTKQSEIEIIKKKIWSLRIWFQVHWVQNQFYHTNFRLERFKNKVDEANNPNANTNHHLSQNNE